MSALMEQHEAWKAARARLLTPQEQPRKPRQVVRPYRPRPLAEIIGAKKPKPEPPAPKWRFVDGCGWISPEGEMVKKTFTAADQIIEEVIKETGVSMIQITGSRRDRPFVAARRKAMWRMSQETGMSLAEIGKKFGDRDHTTVRWAIQTYQALVDAGLE